MIVRAAPGYRVAEEARRIATVLNPSLPLTLFMSMDESVGRARREWDSLARLLGILAGLAAVLSAVGLYGVVAHSVAERQREFSIRAALGASRGDVWRLVLRQSATIIGAGIALGLAGAYAFAKVPDDPAGRRQPAGSRPLGNGGRRADCGGGRGLVETRVHCLTGQSQRHAASAVVSRAAWPRWIYGVPTCDAGMRVDGPWNIALNSSLNVARGWARKSTWLPSVTT